MPAKHTQARDERRLVGELAFPDDERAPAERREVLEMAHVAGAVAADLGAPVIRIRLRHPRAAPAIVAVPEAAMHEDRLFRAEEGDVGIAGNILAMQPVAGRDRPQQAAHLEFRRRIAAGHGAHDGGAIGGLLFSGVSEKPASGSSRCSARKRTTGAATPSPSR